MHDSQIAAVKSFITSNWNSSIRQPATQGPLEIPLQRSFTVQKAGDLFQPFSYWETFFACEGLIREKRLDLVEANTENILSLIEKFGFMPNKASQDAFFFSQPPISMLLVARVFSFKKDRKWLASALKILENEYAFWALFRSGPQPLNHYGWHGGPKDVFNYGYLIQERLKNIPESIVAKMEFLANAIAESESGWEFTPRFDRHCANFYAIDLNSLLFLFESTAATLHEELGSKEAGVWRNRALQRRILINRYCWSDESGFYYDYDYRIGQKSTLETAAAFFALWAGLPSLDQASLMVKRMKQLEFDYGLTACRSNLHENQAGSDPEVYQWDFPNAWPPLQYAAIAGLLQYGFKEDAQRLAQKYVSCVTQNYLQTHNLWEKYNAVTGGTDTSGSGEALPYLGWTAGTFLYALDVLEK